MFTVMCFVKQLSLCLYFMYLLSLRLCFLNNYLYSVFYETIIISVFYETSKGVCGGVVRVVDLKLLAPHPCGFEFRQEAWILTCKKQLRLCLCFMKQLLLCLCVIKQLSLCLCFF